MTIIHIQFWMFHKIYAECYVQFENALLNNMQYILEGGGGQIYGIIVTGRDEEAGIKLSPPKTVKQCMVSPLQTPWS